MSESEQKTGSAAQHQLNVIYFVDASRTRSFRMPLKRLNIILSLLVIVIVWSIASVFILNDMAKDSAGLRQQVASSQSTIFEYQSRYDGVYEMAYPDSKRRGSAIAKQSKERARKKALAEAEAAKEKEQEEKRADEKRRKELAAEKAKKAKEAKAALAAAEAKKDAEKKRAAAAPATKPVAEPATKPAAETVSEETPAEDSFPVSVSSPTIQREGRGLKLKFKLNNSLTNKKSGGHVWAVATLETSDGKKMNIGSPNFVKLDADGKIRTLAGAHRYSIRRFKQTTLSFVFPGGVKGKVTSIRIGLSDRVTKKQSFYDVPVNVTVGEDGT